MNYEKGCYSILIVWETLTQLEEYAMNDLKNHLFCVLNLDIFNNQINEYMTKLTNELCERPGYSRTEERT